MNILPSFHFPIALSWTIGLIFVCQLACTLAAKDLAAEGVAFLAENALKPDVIVRPSGLQYKILNKGSGKKHPTVSRYASLFES